MRADVGAGLPYSKVAAVDLGIPASEYTSGTPGRRVIPLNYGLPAEECFDLEQLQRALEQTLRGRDAKIVQYGGSAGVPKLREWLLERHRSLTDAVNDDVIVTSGSSQALDLIAKLFIDKGDEIWVEAPTYFGALNIFSMYFATIKAFPMDSSGVQVDLLEAELEHRRANGLKLPKFFYCIPTFQNPTGCTLDRNRRQQLAALAIRFGLTVIEDDAYGELNFSGETFTTLKQLAPHNTLYVSTFSKTIAPGLRIGWIIGSGNTIDYLKKMKADGATGGLVQEIAANLLADMNYDDHLRMLRSYYAGKRDFMMQALQQHMSPLCAWDQPAGGYYIWLKLPQNLSAKGILPQAIEKKVRYVPGSFFHADGSGDRNIRLCYSYCPNESIEIGIKRLAAVIGNARNGG